MPIERTVAKPVHRQSATQDISSRSIEEHDVVPALEPVIERGITVPKGTIGTIVFVHREDDAFEVEFDAPVEAVVSVRRRQIEA